MLDRIKQQLNDVITIADSCPEKYQVKCFEVLLNALLSAEGIPSGVKVPGEILMRPSPDFFTRYNIVEEQWQKVFHFDGTAYSIIVSDLNEKTASKKQMKLALLLGVKALLEGGESGEGIIEKGQLVELCKQYAAYDSANFTTYMRRNKNLFLPKGNNWILTKPGQKQAAEVIKELSQ